ncbi:MAG: 50S ribosomal protein L9 [Candidatus Omnitrophica bacterium]|nr:50S ribosomal protein L9 [Candidatus Omnitrophota bacterium]
MKIIIFKKFGKFTKEGDIVEVKDGYARNFLIPKGFALPASEQNIKKFEQLQEEKQRLEKQERKKFLSLKEKIEKTSLTITAEIKEGDEIYGSVTAIQILNALKEEGIELKKENLKLTSPIKKIGVYNLTVELYQDICAKLSVWVVKK